MRELSDDLFDLQTAKQKRPAWKVYVYDINSTKGDTVPDTISRIVQGATLAAITGPLDLTDFVISASFIERSSDFAQGTVAGNSVTMQVADKGKVYDPVGGSESRWLRAGNVIRLVEGDSSLAESEWATTFTGTIVGRAGASDRDRSNNQTLQVAAEDRMATQIKKKITTQSFDQGTEYAFIMRSILETEVGMADTEFDFGAVGGQFTTQASTQIVDESPVTALAKFGFIEGFMPKFRGDGVLVFYENFSTKGVNIIYEDDDLFKQFSRPFSALENVNEVEVLGLEADMTKVPQATQVLATAGVTLGFFGGDARINVAWSDDRTQQADDVRINIVKSVTGALLPFGAEDFDFQTDDDGGSRFGVIEVAGAFYAPLTIVLYAARIAASFIPDTFAGIGSGSTIPVGRLIEGIVSILISTIQATIGTGDYEILGEPYEYVFQEIRGVARVGELPFIDINGISLENHLIDTQVEADGIALRELRTIRKRGNAWSVVMRHDLRLEPGDKFFMPSEDEFIVTEINRTINRDEAQLVTMSVYETTPGVSP